MFELVLAGDYSVRDLVGEDDPGASGWEGEFKLGGIFLIVVAFFHAVVEVEHVMVIEASATAGDVEELHEGAAARKGSGNGRGKPFGDPFERFAHAPAAWLIFLIHV